MRERRRSSSELATLSRTVYELANIEPYKRQPYVGASAFAHKGGLHVAAVQKNAETYEHIDPSSSATASACSSPTSPGRATSLHKAKQFGLDLDTANPAVTAAARRAEGARELRASSSRAPRRRSSC